MIYPHSSIKSSCLLLFSLTMSSIRFNFEEYSTYKKRVFDFLSISQTHRKSNRAPINYLDKIWNLPLLKVVMEVHSLLKRAFITKTEKRKKPKDKIIVKS